MVFNLFVMVAVLFQSVLGQKRPKIKMSNLTVDIASGNTLLGTGGTFKFSFADVD